MGQPACATAAPGQEKPSLLLPPRVRQSFLTSSLARTQGQGELCQLRKSAGSFGAFPQQDQAGQRARTALPILGLLTGLSPPSCCLLPSNPSNPLAAPSNVVVFLAGISCCQGFPWSPSPWPPTPWTASWRGGFVWLLSRTGRGVSSPHAMTPSLTSSLCGLCSLPSCAPELLPLRTQTYLLLPLIKNFKNLA